MSSRVACLEPAAKTRLCQSGFRTVGLGRSVAGGDFLWRCNRLLRNRHPRIGNTLL